MGQGVRQMRLRRNRLRGTGAVRECKIPKERRSGFCKEVGSVALYPKDRKKMRKVGWKGWTERGCAG